MRKIQITAVAALSSLLLAVPSVSQAAPDGSTHVDTLNVSLGANAITITGSATYVGESVTVSEDGVGDATIPGVGTDIGVGTISRPMGTNNLVFKWTIGDQLPAPVIADPAASFQWPIMLNETDNGFFLMAGRAGGFPSPSTNPGHSLMQDGADGFSTVTRLTGSTFGNGEVSWNLPMSRIGAKTGDLLMMGSGAPGGVILGVWETVYGILILDDFSADEYVIPGASVKMGIGPAGSLPEEVELTISGTAAMPSTAGVGNFSGAIPKPPAGSGEHVVVVQACYGPNLCGLASKTITV